MTKEEILIKYMLNVDPEYTRSDVEMALKGNDPVSKILDGFLQAMEDYAQQAIADHEAGKWMKYPENKPETGEMYNVTDGIETCIAIYGGRGYFEVEGIRIPGVIAFRELPAPFQEGGEG